MGVVVILLFYIFHKINSKNNIKIENMSNTLETYKNSINNLINIINQIKESKFTITGNITSTGYIKGNQLCIGNTCINENLLKNIK